MKTNHDIGIYPNPVTSILYFKGVEKIDKVEIYNMVGQKVKTFNSVDHQIDVSSLLSGDYILRYSVEGEKQQSYKFIKR